MNWRVFMRRTARSLSYLVLTNKDEILKDKKVLNEIEKKIELRYTNLLKEKVK
jgi:hypothetical protein